MGDRVSPVVRSRRLAAVLRQLRLDAGRTIEEVAIHLECSAAKVSRIENGLVTVRIQDARDLLDLYAIQGSQRDRLLELVRQARGRAWWYPFADLMAEGFDRVIEFEEEAAAIWMLEARIVPGLLQTEAYATALMSSRRDVPTQTIERAVRLRMMRQDILARPDPPQLHLLLDEAAVRRRVGPPALMAEQCKRLASTAGAPNITLRIIPLAAELHQAPGFSFTVFGFVDPADPKIVFEELLEDVAFHESAERVGRYTLAFEQAKTSAWDETTSLSFLTQLAEQATDT